MFSSTAVVLLIDNVATFLGQIALILMKEVNNSKSKGFLWLSGLILLILSSVIHVAVLPYADLVLLSSSSATAILFGILLSVYWLGETFDFHFDLPGVMLTCAGCVTTVAFANTSVQDLTLD